MKHCGPNHWMVFLGVLFDTQSMTLSVMEDRVQEIMEILESWLDKCTASQKEYQVLLGKLNFVVSCIKQGQIFVSRIIAYTKTLAKVGKFPVPQSVKRDLLWWYRILPEYNGVSMMVMEEWSSPDEVFATDACLLGCGAWNEDRQFFHVNFPNNIRDMCLDLNSLELLTIIVAC